MGVTTRAMRQGVAGAPPPPPSPPPLPPLDFKCLEGVRALASMWIALLHCYTIWCFLIPHYVRAPLVKANVLVRLAAAGGLGVDFLLVLSALLACYQLVPALEGSAGSGSKGAPSCWEVVRAYWSRRARRLLPAYGATLALLAAALPEMGGAPVEAAVAHALDFPHCPSALWRSLAFLADLDTPSTCGYHLWSVSLQVQFFLAFPLILCALRPRAPGFRARLAAVLAATVAASTAWRLWSAASVPGGLRLPLGDLSQPEEMAAVRALLQAVYFGPGVRAAQLAAGAALGLLLRSPTAVGWLRHRRGLVAGAAFAVQAAYWAVLATWDHNVRQLSEDPTWRPFEATLFAGLLYFGGPLVTALACATMLALMLRSDALHAAAASALGSAALRPAASLSYCLYLVHDHARLWGLVLLLPSGLLPGGSFQAWAAAAPVSSLVGLTAYTLLCGYTAAALMQRLVERRCG